MSSTNGVVGKAFQLRPPYGPPELSILLAAFNQVLLGLCVDDAERGAIAAHETWEEGPNVTQLIGALKRRATTEDERELLRIADRLRLLLPSRPIVKIPAELLERTAVATDKVTAADVARGAALEEVVRARQAEARAEPGSDKAERCAAVRVAAEASYADAASAHERALAALGRVLAERDVYARRAILMAEAQ